MASISSRELNTVSDILLRMIQRLSIGIDGEVAVHGKLGDRIFPLRKVGSRMMKVAARDFDLEKTLSCGQVFHWEKSRDGFVGAIGDKAVYVEQRGDELHFAGVTG